jgi:uncharacterized membrane protein
MYFHLAYLLSATRASYIILLGLFQAFLSRYSMTLPKRLALLPLGLINFLFPVSIILIYVDDYKQPRT